MSPHLASPPTATQVASRDVGPSLLRATAACEPISTQQPGWAGLRPLQVGLAVSWGRGRTQGPVLPQLQLRMWAEQGWGIRAQSLSVLAPPGCMPRSRWSWHCRGAGTGGGAVGSGGRAGLLRNRWANAEGGRGGCRDVRAGPGPSVPPAPQHLGSCG